MLDPALAQQTRLPTASRRPVWAWMLSILLHTVLLTSVGLYAGRSPRDAGSPSDPDRPVSVALVHRLTERQESPPDPPAAHSPAAGETADQSMPSAAATAAVPPDFAPPFDLAGVLAEMTAVVGPDSANGFVASEIDDAGLLTEPGDGEGRGDRGLKAATAESTGTASLFGVSGSGSRFVYIVDRSDSMNRFASRPLRVAKTELKRSLEMLTGSQSFQLVLYNDQPRPYRGGNVGGPLQMLPGDTATITRAQRYLDSVEAFGGTNHVDALRLSLRMGPDVIFFLTDGHIPSLNQQEMSDIRRLAERGGTVIHAIEFGTEPAPHPQTFVRRLAAENRGEYRYFDVRHFSDSQRWQPEAPEPNP